MNCHTGTSGYSYKEWKGKFYPEKLPAKQMLSYYAERFNSVEINATFYRMPRESVLVQWTEQVPDGFQFVLKASRRITHRKAFDEAAGETEYFLRTSTSLAEKQGPTLAQLPPFSKKNLDRLGRFLDQFPRRWRLAMEFRHQSWFDEEVYSFLRDRNVCLVYVDDPDSKVETELVSTSDWGYLRLRGQDYDDDDLQRWADSIIAQSWSDAFVFFKHEDEGTGPELAQRFKGLFT